MSKKKGRTVGTGARAPEEFAWQEGKTAASIKFVGDAEQFISRGRELFANGALRIVIGKIKDGSLVLSEFTTPEQMLDQIIEDLKKFK